MRHVLLFAALTFATISNAATITFSGITPTNVFNYQLVISNERLMSGDYFVIYDFAGVQSASGPANWTTQITLNDVNASNDINVSDIRFTYSGTTPLTSANGNPSSVITLSGFTITSSSSLTRQDSYYALTTNKNNNNDVVQNGATTVADLFVPPPPASVPEPTTLSLLGGGLALIPLARRRFMAGDK